MRAVLTEYADYLPLTVRQIFYRLVGAHDYDKTQHAYDNLGEHLVKARRARLISFDAIRDDGGTVLLPSAWGSAGEFLGACRAQAAELQLDRTKGQKTRLPEICEAAGMAPQLGRIANPFGVPVMSGGFDSLATNTTSPPSAPATIGRRKCSEFIETPAKRDQPGGIAFGGPAADIADHRRYRLLRPRRQWPDRRTPEPCNKFAPSHLQSSRFKIGAERIESERPSGLVLAEFTNRGTTK